MLCWCHVVVSFLWCRYLNVKCPLAQAASLQLIWRTRACKLRSSRTRTLLMFIGCDSLLQLYLVLNSAFDQRRYSHLRATQVKKVRRGFPSFDFGKLSFCCSWNHLVSAHNETHLLRIFFFFFFWATVPLHSPRDDIWNVPTPLSPN